MRGFHLLLMWIMALAITNAHAKKVSAPSVTVQDEDLRVETKKEDKKVSSPPVHVEDEDLDVEDDVPAEEEVVYDEEEETIVAEEPAPLQENRHFSLEINGSFGRSLGCIIPNCGSFVPMQRMCGGVYVQGYANQCQPPQYRQVVYQDVYVNEQSSNYQMRGYCPCQGQMGCGCGARTPVLFVNNVQPMPTPTPTWRPLVTRTAPVWGPTPQAVFEVPTQQQHSLNPRNTGFIPREGFPYNAGSY
ncbi:MAG: hypothetical protein R3A80_00600 [Bdellovibrionota bacterium]